MCIEGKVDQSIVPPPAELVRKMIILIIIIIINNLNFILMSKLIYGALKLVTSAQELPARLTSIGGKNNPMPGTQFTFDGIVEMPPIEIGGKPYFAVQCTDIEKNTLFNLSINTIKGVYFKFGETTPTQTENCIFDNTKSLFDFVTEHVTDSTIFEIGEPQTYSGTNFKDKTMQSAECVTYSIFEEVKSKPEKKNGKK